MSEKLAAGWGEADITPAGRVAELSGQYYQRVAREIHSPLKAVALLLARGRERSVMISLDVVGVSGEVCREFQALAADAAPGLSPDRVIIGATHTHTAPALQAGRAWWPPESRAIPADEYRALVGRRVAEAVRAAWENRRPARVAGVLQAARTGHCRRAVYDGGSAEMYGRTDRPDFLGMEAGEDSGVELCFFLDGRGRPFGVVVNAACPAQVMEATRRVSADYPGALREKLKGEFGDGFTTLCQVSAAGCQSPRDLVRGYRGGEPDFWHEDGVEVLAERLREAVVRGRYEAAGRVEADPAFAHLSRAVALPKRLVSYEAFRRAEGEVARLEAACDSARAYRDFCAEIRANEAITGRPGPYDSKLHHFVLIRNAEAVVNRYREQFAAPEIEFELHALRLGESVFVTNPFELYLEYGQRIKARSRARRTFVTQLANGSFGYLPTRRAEQLGGYGGLVINGRVGSDGGRKLVDETLAAIAELFPASKPRVTPGATRARRRGRAR